MRFKLRARARAYEIERHRCGMRESGAARESGGTRHKKTAIIKCVCARERPRREQNSATFVCMRSLQKQKIGHSKAMQKASRPTRERAAFASAKSNCDHHRRRHCLFFAGAPNCLLNAAAIVAAPSCRRRRRRRRRARCRRCRRHCFRRCSPRAHKVYLCAASNLIERRLYL